MIITISCKAFSLPFKVPEVVRIPSFSSSSKKRNKRSLKEKI